MRTERPVSVRGCSRRDAIATRSVVPCQPPNSSRRTFLMPELVSVISLWVLAAFAGLTTPPFWLLSVLPAG